MTIDPYKRRVRDMLSKHVVAVHSNDSVHEALSLMVENRVAALPVVDRRSTCVGILSATDVVEMTLDMGEQLNELDRASDVPSQAIIDKLAEHDMDRRTVGELMTESVASIGPESPLADAARKMLRHKVHRLPVLDKERRLVGLISTTDVLTAFVEGAPV